VKYLSALWSLRARLRSLRVRDLLRQSIIGLMQHSPFIRLGKVVVSASDTLPKDDILRKTVMHLFAQIGLCVTAAYRSFVTLRAPTIFMMLNEYLSHLSFLSLAAIMRSKLPRVQGAVANDGPHGVLADDIRSKRSFFSLILLID